MSGSRLIQQDISIYDPADAAFCEKPVPEGKINVVGDGECGVNGNAVYFEMYGISSYEKDGTVHTFSMGDVSSRVDATGDGRTFQQFTPVNNLTISGTVLVEPIMATFEWVFLDEDYTRLTINAHMYERNDTNGKEFMPVHGFRTFLTRVSEEEWIAEMKKTYKSSNVLEADRPQESPLEGSTCLSGVCPTEEDWCQLDPKCSISPYQEPDGTIRAGVLAGFCTAFFLVLFLAAYFWHLRILAEQAARNRRNFVRRVAGSIRLSTTSRVLTPNALAQRFQDIDTAKGARKAKSSISKEELWDFIVSGEAGDMTRSDFEALFEAMDEDGNGTVDFLEFCAFLGGCADELAAANLNRHQRLSLIARRVSTTMAPLPPSILEDLDEEDDPESNESTPLVSK